MPVCLLHLKDFGCAVELSYQRWIHGLHSLNGRIRSDTEAAGNPDVDVAAAIKESDGPDLSRAIAKTTQSADNVVTPTDPRNVRPRAKSVDTVRKSATLNPSVEAEKSERERRDEKERISTKKQSP